MTLCLFAALLMGAASAPKPGHPASIAGLWAVERVLGPKVRGTLTIDARRSPWRARIAGYDVPVEHDGSTIRFTLPNGAGAFRGHVEAAEPRGLWIRGSWDRTTDRLALPLLDGQPALVLGRRATQDAEGFVARPGPPAYHYRMPAAADDGWEVSSLANVGLDEHPIDALVQQILAANPADDPLDIHSLLIARHGKLVLEEYF